MLYLAEFYLPGDASLDDVVRRARVGAAEARRAGTDVRFVRAVFVPGDESCFAVYRASTADQVAVAGVLAELAFDRVVEALAWPQYDR